ncbi:glycosyltransferase family 4 protein [Pseudomonadales bacterium]|jgi:glycosyltransferase involved in cell wall biosynthesis|nr:glycosyltransferase family 4 protein [Pseudomonadales bacterium]MDB2449496.1 glycosyltransferase family 4 protein [Pseudomonadales bacterium]MDC1083171.1 glycosyltransferase family 4 protein [Pseudomonadales bacterium]MDC6449410.1 glycosyltransferase family 4 protein [Pseudomonadales bacterium]
MNDLLSAEKDKKPSLCLVAHNAYGVLAKKETSHVGGIEVQVPMMSKWFVEQGYNTTMIAWDDDYPDGISHDGVMVRKLCKESDGIPIVRFIHPRWTSFVGALNRADADVYYYNCGDMGLGQLVLWSRLHRKKVVYSIANDVDCVQELPALKPFREKFLYKYGLMNCDSIICQTEKQRQLLMDEYGLVAEVIRMPCEGFPKNRLDDAKSKNNEKKHILWAGRFTPEKRLEYFFELAKLFPDMIFDVIGDYNFEKDTSYANELKQLAEGIDNVVLHGRIPHEKMGEYFNKSYLLCSTSVYEGFPNIYLEAWSVGLPLVTTFDPDGVVREFGLGRIAHDVETLRTAVAGLLSEADWEKAASAAESYFFNHHTLSSSMIRFEGAFKEPKPLE